MLLFGLKQKNADIGQTAINDSGLFEFVKDCSFIFLFFRS